MFNTIPRAKCNRKLHVYPLEQECQTHFHQGHISLMVAFKGPNVILGLCKCNYSLTRGKELYIQPFEGNRKADVAPSENEFDTPARRWTGGEIDGKVTVSLPHYT